MKLMDRILSVSRLYKEFEKQWTPSALSFSQALWDVSVNETLHRIGLLQSFRSSVLIIWKL